MGRIRLSFIRSDQRPAGICRRLPMRLGKAVSMPIWEGVAPSPKAKRPRYGAARFSAATAKVPSTVFNFIAFRTRLVTGKTNASPPKRLVQLGIQGKCFREPVNGLPDFAEICASLFQRLGNEAANQTHLFGSHPPGGEGGCAHADPAGDKGAFRLEGDGVLVHGDAHAVQKLFRLLTGEALGLNLDQQEVIVGAT